MPDGGEVTVLGLDVAREADALKPRIGVSLQTAALYPKLTVTELIDLFRSFYPTTRPTGELIDALELGERRHAQSQVLSGGRSASPSPSPWSTIRRSCSSMSRRPAWIRGAAVALGPGQGFRADGGPCCSRRITWRRPRSWQLDRDHGPRPILEIDDRRAGDQAVPRAGGALRPRRGLGRTDVAVLPEVTEVLEDETEVLVYGRTSARPSGRPGPRRRALRGAPEPGDPASHARGRLPRPDRSGVAGLSADRAMRALIALTVANIRSYLRPRGAVLDPGVPAHLHLHVRVHLPGGGSASLSLGWVDEDGSPAATGLREAFVAQDGTEVADGDRDAALAQMREGEVDAVIVVPAGYGEAIAAGAAGSGGPTPIVVYTDPSQSNTVASVYQAVGAVLGVVNLGGGRLSCLNWRRSRPRT